VHARRGCHRHYLGTQNDRERDHPSSYRSAKNCGCHALASPRRTTGLGVEQRELYIASHNDLKTVLGELLSGNTEGGGRTYFRGVTRMALLFSLDLPR
jgi:hypothetical protein